MDKKIAGDGKARPGCKQTPERALDEKIALIVMGWQLGDPARGESRFLEDRPEGGRPIGHFSAPSFSGIAQYLSMLLNRMSDLGWDFTIKGGGINTNVMATFGKLTHQGHISGVGLDETLLLAVCHAAVDAITLENDV